MQQVSSDRSPLPPRFFWRSVGVLFLLFFMGACGGTKEWQDDGLAYFSRKGNGLNPSFRLFHVSSDSSVLHFLVAHDELLYTRSSANAPFRARVKVQARVLNEEGKSLKLDSTFIEDQGKGGGHSYGKLPLRWKEEIDKGKIKVLFRDVERGRSFRGKLPFDRKGANARQNFLPVHPKKKTPFFKVHFSELERIGIRYEREDRKRLHVRAYDREFPLPPPPFAEKGFHSFDYAADSLFTFSRDSASYFEVPVPEEGFFHLQVDSSKGREGFTYFHFRKGYPQVTTVEAMLGPIRYLTSEKEFAALKARENTKAAVDSFWVARGGSKERARKLIEAYYQRVETANRHFTSHVQGWKTDRGLIHVIFGEPVRVETTPSGEKWVYGEDSEIMTLSFDFRRVENPFTKKDMTLKRDPMYKRSWYRAVETWRNGRVYSH